MIPSRGLPNHQALTQLAKQFPELDVPSIEACLTFLDTTAEVYQAFDAHFARYNLSMGKFTLLIQLFTASDKGLTPSEFAERSGVTRATITGLLDGLEKEDLVKRQPYPEDRRRLTIVLTDKGRELISKMLPDHFCRTTNMMSNLTATEKKTFIKLLAKLSAGTSAMRDI
ncbi:MAG: MarR family transcriptional regulator [Rivularia sp. (in: Bacteria)]|nr:MarR family transcriptional regulator [Rivularia sp. MS3]